MSTITVHLTPEHIPHVRNSLGFKLGSDLDLQGLSDLIDEAFLSGPEDSEDATGEKVFASARELIDNLQAFLLLDDLVKGAAISAPEVILREVCRDLIHDGGDMADTFTRQHDGRDGERAEWWIGELEAGLALRRELQAKGVELEAVTA